MVLMPLLSRLLTLLVILTMPLFLARLTLIPIKYLSIWFRVRRISITTILKRRGCLTVPRLTLMSLFKMMLVMVSVAAISKTFGLLLFLMRLIFLAKLRLLLHLLTLWVCKLFLFQAEDGIRVGHVTGVQTCALPISAPTSAATPPTAAPARCCSTGR